MGVFEQILAARGLDGARLENFLQPEYARGHDPFLLPDMEKAVERLVAAREKQEYVTIYGDYDIDGLTASALLVDALASFGFENVEVFIPNRFVEGYGLTMGAVDKILETPATLILTVDCGSLSEVEIVYAKENGVDVIVTDHHNVAPLQPPAVAVINPKRLLQDFPDDYEDFILKSDLASDFSAAASFRQDDLPSDSLDSAELPAVKQSSNRQESAVKSSGKTRASKKTEAELYPFLDLPGVGVAFKLVQALQTRLPGLEEGQEKWLLDLVALGTVCDVVTLRDENRTHVFWGLKVLQKTRRPGLRALMAVSRVEPHKVNARSLGFGLGPRMNAAGRLETAEYALKMLTATSGEEALEFASQLDEMNAARRSEQDKILKNAIIQAEERADDNVLVVSAPGWNHGIIGIVAAKLLEKYKKPTYVLEENVAQHERSERASGGGDETLDSFQSESEGQVPPEISNEAKGSARSYGDFSAADAIRASDDIITKGGGHKLAAGVTLPTANIAAFRERVNEHYTKLGLNLVEQQQKLLPKADATAKLSEVNEELLQQIDSLEPFGNGNERPILYSENLLVERMRRMGADNQHVKLTLSDGETSMDFLAFNAEPNWFVEPGEYVDVWHQPEMNEWQGRRSVEGRIVDLQSA